MHLQHRVTVRVPQDYDTSRLRVRDFRVETLKSGVWFVLSETTRWIDVPPDLFLPGRELRALGTDMTLEDLITFCQEWGVFWDPRDRDVDTAYPPQEALGAMPGLGGQGLVAQELLDANDWRTARFWAEKELGMSSGFGPSRVVHPLELAARIDSATNVAEFWDALQDKDADLGDMAIPTLILNAALSVFGMSVIFDGDEDLLPEPTVYNMGALQIATDLLNSAVTKICANETCQQPFTKQRGRAAKGTLRSTGVLYCSADCAQAQGQREYRRRLKAKATTNKGETK